MTLLRAEYIVSFKGYYTESAREGFITAALRGRCRHWHVVLRNNSGRCLPSDFSVVHVAESNSSSCVDALARHSAVRLVSPQQKFSRSLACLSSPASASGVKCRRLSNGGRKLLRAIPRQVTSALHADVLWTMGHLGQGIKVRRGKELKKNANTLSVRMRFFI